MLWESVSFWVRLDLVHLFYLSSFAWTTFHFCPRSCCSNTSPVGTWAPDARPAPTLLHQGWYLPRIVLLKLLLYLHPHFHILKLLETSLWCCLWQLLSSLWGHISYENVSSADGGTCRSPDSGVPSRLMFLNLGLTEMLAHLPEVLELQQITRKNWSKYPFALKGVGQGIPMASDPNVE